MVRADARLKQGFPLVTLPVLILHGSADKAPKPSGSQLFYDTAGSKDKTLKLYEGHVHDLLNDLGKEAGMADIKAWIAARLPQAGSTQRLVRGESQRGLYGEAAGPWGWGVFFFWARPRARGVCRAKSGLPETT